MTPLQGSPENAIEFNATKLLIHHGGAGEKRKEQGISLSPWSGNEVCFFFVRWIS